MDWIKRLFASCNHEWEEFNWGVVDTPSGRAWTVDLYCPKCDKTKSMFKRDWDYKKRLAAVKQKHKNVK